MRQKPPFDSLVKDPSVLIAKTHHSAWCSCKKGVRVRQQDPLVKSGNCLAVALWYCKTGGGGAGSKIEMARQRLSVDSVNAR